MTLVRTVATSISSTLPARFVSSLVLRRLRRRSSLDHYEDIAFSKLVGFFAIGERSAIAELRNGLRIRVRTDDHVGRVLYAMGDYQPRVSWVARRLLDPGDTVLDIGANIGWFVCTAAPLVGAEGRVVAFEPQPTLAAMLRETCSLNGLSQVSVQQFALSDHDGHAHFQVLTGNTGAGRIGETTPGSEWRQVEVETRETAKALERLELGRVRLLKIDVEGHEATILKACEASFRGREPNLVLFESNPWCEEGPFHERETVKILKRLGYRIFQFRPSQRTVLLAEVPLDGKGTEFSNDFVAIHQGERFQDDIRRLGIKLGCEG